MRWMERVLRFADIGSRLGDAAKVAAYHCFLETGRIPSDDEISSLPSSSPEEVRALVGPPAPSVGAGMTMKPSRKRWPTVDEAPYGGGAPPYVLKSKYDFVAMERNILRTVYERAQQALAASEAVPWRAWNEGYSASASDSAHGSKTENPYPRGDDEQSTEPVDPPSPAVPRGMSKFWVVRDVKAHTDSLNEVFTREDTVPYLREVAGAGLERVEAEHHRIHVTEEEALEDLVRRLERCAANVGRLLEEARARLAVAGRYRVLSEDLPAGEKDYESGTLDYADAVQLAEHLHAEKDRPHVVTLERTAEVVYVSKGAPA